MNRKVEDKIAVVTGGSAGIGLGTIQRFAAEGARALIIGAPRYSQSLDKMVEHTRNRAAEFHLNGTCLVRAICCGAFRKVPFFLRHLWCALAE
jgi:NAD(P)-dependent dehydrogenase (short-subunit alcohol dehydrogenase family)